ncbi:glycerophosphodiester phosphodiesterase [Metabacillus sp. HB246100]
MTKIIGHRGFAGKYPENTMVSFKAAVDAGADGIELDVQMTKDGEIVVIHDETVDRTTDANGYVKDFTLEDISLLDASFTYKQFTGMVKVPTLKEVLEWGRTIPTLILNIELKNGIVTYPGLERKVIQMITSYGMEDQVILSSFNHYSLVECKRINDRIKTAILYMEGLYKPYDYAKGVGADGLHPYYLAITSSIIKESQKLNGLPIRPFTVNDEKVMRKLMVDKVSASITDLPDIAISIKDSSVRCGC